MKPLLAKCTVYSVWLPHSLGCYSGRDVSVEVWGAQGRSVGATERRCDGDGCYPVSWQLAFSLCLSAVWGGGGGKPRTQLRTGSTMAVAERRLAPEPPPPMSSLAAAIEELEELGGGGMGKGLGRLSRSASIMGSLPMPLLPSDYAAREAVRHSRSLAERLLDADPMARSATGARASFQPTTHPPRHARPRTRAASLTHGLPRHSPSASPLRLARLRRLRPGGLPHATDASTPFRTRCGRLRYRSSGAVTPPASG